MKKEDLGEDDKDKESVDLDNLSYGDNKYYKSKFKRL